jgi:peptidoglycan/LPS O-acetylase OafA/YrhL
MAPNRRNHAIDALRGFSILIVMMLHGVAPIPEFIRSTPWAVKPIANGGYGVSIFFVISGFLISSNVIRRYNALHSVQIDQFYAMRIGRILPCVLLFIALYWILFTEHTDKFVPSPPSLFYEGVTSLFQLQYGTFYLAKGNVPGMYAFSPLWSLSIEETFYVFFPVVCFLLRTDKMIVCLACAFAALGPFMRPQFADTLLFWGAVDLLSIGCIAAKIASVVRDRPTYQRLAVPLILLGIIGIGACLFLTAIRDDSQWALSVIGPSTAAILVGVSFDTVSNNSGRLSAMLLLPLSFLGRMSLQLYIFHVMARELFAPRPGQYIVLGSLIVSAWALERWLLEPANRWIRTVYQDGSETVPVSIDSERLSIRGP